MESSGTDKKTMQQINLERGEFEKKLFEYIKENKICLLEDMSIEFKIPTKAVVDTIKSLGGAEADKWGVRRKRQIHRRH